MDVSDLNVRWYHGDTNEQGVDPKVAERINKPHRSTVCEIRDKNGETIAKGQSILHENDNFSRDTGRRISLRRALEAGKLPKKVRTQVWEAYRTEMTPKPRW